MAVGRRLGVVVPVAVLLVLVTPAAGQAHPSVLATSPPAGYSVMAAPQRVEVVFDEPVSVADGDMRLLADDGRAVPTSAVRRVQQGRRIALTVSEDLAPGRYVVRWTVTAADGDVVEGGFDFAVAGEGARTGATELAGNIGGGTAGLPAAVVLRWMLLAGVIVAVGGWVGDRLARQVAAGHVSDAGVRMVAAPLRVGAALGAAGAAGLLAHQAGRGSVTAGLFTLARGDLPGGPAARIIAAELALLTAAVALASTGRLRVWALVPLAGVILAEGVRTHASARAGPAGALLMAVHLGAAAVWVGGLVQVLRTARAWRGHPEMIRQLIGAYAWTAARLVAAVAVTGTAAALILVPSLGELVGTNYGRLLVIKLALVLTAVGLAWAARRALRRDGGTGRVVRRAATERAVLAAVLALSAMLVSAAAPGQITADVGYPTAAAGPVVRQGWLAGQVSVQIAASENLLEVRLRTLDADPGIRVITAQFEVAARVVTGGGAGPRAVPLRPCGPGCFLAPVGWGVGANSVDLAVQAEGWHGGSAAFTVVWPPRTNPRVLAEVVAAMRAAGTFRLTETVSSDTSRPAPQANILTVSAERLLEGEPYGDGSGIDVIDLGPPSVGPGSREIIFGLPAEGVAIRMVLDASSRILRETISAPKHQIEREFAYPGAPDQPGGRRRGLRCGIADALGGHGW